MAIVIAYKNEARFPELCEVDCAIATENIWLEAEALDLGAVMLAVAPFEDRMRVVESILDMPSGTSAFAIIPIGYPLNKAKQQNRYDDTKVFYV